MGQAQIIGTVFVFFGLACSVVSTVIDHWCYAYFHKDPTYKSGYALYFGLWNRCKKYEVTGRLVTECTSWLEYRIHNGITMPWLHCCQVMMIFATWFYGSAFFAALAYIKVSQQTRSVAYACGLGSICCLVAIIVFASKRGSVFLPSHGHDSLRAAFGLAVASILFGAIGTFFLWRHSTVPGYQNIDVL